MKTHAIWICVSIAALFLGTRFSETRIVEKPVEVTKTKEVIVEKPVEIIREVPKEVEKIVERKIEVPAQIPEVYQAAYRFTENYLKAPMMNAGEVLSSIPDVSVLINFAENIEPKPSEREFKDSIELALRKNGLRVNANSLYLLVFDVTGLWDKEKVVYSFSAAMELSEPTPLWRENTFKRKYVTIWKNSYTGYAGRDKLKDALPGVAEKLVVSFSNAYLAANEKTEAAPTK